MAAESDFTLELTTWDTTSITYDIHLKFSWQNSMYASNAHMMLYPRRLMFVKQTSDASH